MRLRASDSVIVFVIVGRGRVEEEQNNDREDE